MSTALLENRREATRQKRVLAVLSCQHDFMISARFDPSQYDLPGLAETDTPASFFAGRAQEQARIRDFQAALLEKSFEKLQLAVKLIEVQTALQIVIDPRFFDLLQNTIRADKRNIWGQMSFLGRLGQEKRRQGGRLLETPGSVIRKIVEGFERWQPVLAQGRIDSALANEDEQSLLARIEDMRLDYATLSLEETGLHIDQLEKQMIAGLCALQEDGNDRAAAPNPACTAPERDAAERLKKIDAHIVQCRNQVEAIEAFGQASRSAPVNGRFRPAAASGRYRAVTLGRIPKMPLDLTLEIVA